MQLRQLNLFIITGELSGDLLVTAVIDNLFKYCNHNNIKLHITGILGPKLLNFLTSNQIKFNKIANCSDLAVFGLIEPLKHIINLWTIYKNCIKFIVNNKLDLLLTVDAPDFSFRVIKKVKQLNNKHLKICHIVCPSIWAWRKSRVKFMQQYLDKLLVLLPFESKYFVKNNYANNFTVKYVGHPLADQIEVYNNLNHNTNLLKIALLPGSRNQEIKKLGLLLIKTAKLAYKYNNNFTFVMPLACINHVKQLNILHAIHAPDVPLTIELNNTVNCLKSVDAAIVTSGTATLEAMLCKIPMVVIYKLNWLTYFFAKLLVNIRYISLPNILAEKQLIPEVVQYNLTPYNLYNLLLTQLEINHKKKLIAQFTKLHIGLKVKPELKDSMASLAKDEIIDLCQI